MDAETIFSVFTILISLIALILSMVADQRSAELAELSKASLQFHKTTSASYFRRTRPEEMYYIKSVCFAFVAVSMSNFSNLPVTIREFRLSIPGYEPCWYRSSTKILPEGHILYYDPSYREKDGVTNPNVSILSSSFVPMPCVFSPYGYHEGFLLFPYAPLYEEKEHKATITAITTRGDFSYTVTMYPVSYLKRT